MPLAANANAAVTLDFELFRAEDARLHDHPGSLIMDGFVLTSVPPPGNAFLFVSAETTNQLFAGSTGLWNGQSQAEIVLTAKDGGVFTLLSIDVAAIAPGASDPNGLTSPGPFELSFTGTLVGGGIVTNTFTVNNNFLSFETFVFSGFNDVVSVSWFQGAGFNPGFPVLRGQASHQFDRIVLEQTVVPEPESWMMLIGLGLASFGKWSGRGSRARHDSGIAKPSCLFSMTSPSSFVMASEVRR